MRTLVRYGLAELCNSIVLFAFPRTFLLSCTVSNAVKPMKKTVTIGLFFFFIHILMSSDWNIVQKHILGCEYCKCGGGGWVIYFPWPPPLKIVYELCCKGQTPLWPGQLPPPPSQPPNPRYPRIHGLSIREVTSGREGWDLTWPGSYKRSSFP